MTRKDYVLIADALKRAGNACASPSPIQHATDCHVLADALARDNPRFDRARFLKASGVTP